MTIEKQEMTYLENWIADRIEPLVVTLTAVTEDTRKIMRAYEQEIERRNQEAERLQKETQRLQRQWSQNQEDMIRQAQRVVGKLTWRFILIVMSVSILVGVAAPTAYVLMAHGY